MVKVLIMEDDLELGALISSVLEDNGHAATHYTDGSSAMFGFENGSYDVVISDIIVKKSGRAIPDGGIKLIWRIKHMATMQKRKVAIIAISGSVGHAGMQDILVTAQSMGADHVLEKPFTPAELIMLIDEVSLPKS